MTTATIRPTASGEPVHGPRKSIVTLDSVTVRFDGKEPGSNAVLSDFSLECAEGEFLVLVGRSGCGKTTVLNLLAGLLTQQQGTVEVLGRQPQDARSDMGYMFARDALVPSRTALANVELGLEVRGVKRRERRKMARALLKKLHLDEAEDRYPWQLSQGMRQRVALARTWTLSPKLVLMDEPFAALDAQTRVEVRREFLEVWERTKSSVVFVTHDLTEALLLGDRVILLGPGGHIAGDFTLPFSRPRNEDELPYTDEFRAMERKLHKLLENID